MGGCRDDGGGEGWLEMVEGGGVEPAEGQQTTINVHIAHCELRRNHRYMQVFLSSLITHNCVVH